MSVIIGKKNFAGFFIFALFLFALFETLNPGKSLAEIFNESLDGSGDSLVVAPGDTVNVSLEYSLSNPEWCPACIRQIVIGIEDDALYCIYNGIPAVSPGLTTGYFSENIVAPGVGQHRLVATYHMQFNCPDAMALHSGTAPEQFGTIYVVDANLNGAGREVTVNPDDSITVVADYGISNPESCPGCIRQIVMGIGDDALYCVYNGIPQTTPGQTFGTSTQTVTAPAVPGTYALNAAIDWQMNCGDAMALYPNGSVGQVGTIVVQNPPLITQGDAITVVMDEDGSPTPFALTLDATDAEGGLLAWSIAVPPSNGSVSASGAGNTVSVSYAPDPDYNGPDSFEMQVEDPYGATDTITVNVDVSPQNDPPEITEGASANVTMDEDGSPVAFSLVLNATDVDSNILNWSMSSPASNGTVAASGVGESVAIAYMPNPDFNGTDSFAVIVEDGGGGADEITVNVAVAAQNDPPVIAEGESVNVTMDEDGSPVPFSLALSMTDADGDTMTLSVSSPASNGSATVDGTTVDYIPNTDYNGSDSFELLVSDGAGGTDTITVNVTVNPTNDPPVISEGESVSVTMSEDGDPTPFSLDLNSSDIDSDELAWSISAQAAHGTAAVSGTGISMEIGYSPNPNFNGTDSFVVMVADGAGGTDTVTVNVDVVGLNDPPEISGQNSVATSEETPLTIVPSHLIVSDFDSNWPGDFTLTVLDGDGYERAGNSITPAVDYNGTLLVKVTVNDGEFDSNVFDLAVTVVPVNDMPEITGQTSISAAEDTLFVIVPEYLIVNDPDGVYPSGYTLKIHEGENYTADGNRIIPASDYNGPLRITVSVNDGGIDSPPFVFAVDVENVNDPPVLTGVPTGTALEDELWTYEIAVNDPDGDTLAFETEIPSWMTFADNGDGSVVLSGTPGNDDVGVYEISLEVADPDGETDGRTFSLEVVNVNDPPAIVEQAPLSTLEETPIAVELGHLEVEDPDNVYPDEFTLHLLDRSFVILPEETGVTSAVLGDVNGDGQTDLVIGISGRPDRLYLNSGDGFEKDAGTDIVSESVDTAGLFMIDEDLDGDQDVISADSGGNYVLYRNAGGMFEVVETENDSLSFSNRGAFAFGDVNGDGLSDMIRAEGGMLRIFMSDPEFRNPFYTLEGATVTPVIDYNGIITVPVSVNDGAEGSELWPLEIEVMPLNDQPLVFGQRDLTVDGAEIEIEITDLSVFDPDSAWPGEFTFEVYDGENYETSGTTVIPDADFTGTLVVPVTVRDAQMMSNRFDLEIVVGTGEDIESEKGLISGTIRFPEGAAMGDRVEIAVFSESLAVSETVVVEFGGETEAGYKFSGLPHSDDYVVSVHPDSYMVRYFDGSEYGAADSDGAEPLTPDSSGAVSANFTLDPGVTLSGTVRGEGAGEVRVEVWPVNGGSPKGVTIMIGESYAIGGLERGGTYKAVAWERDMAPFFYSETGTVRLESLASSLTFEVGDRTNVDIELTLDESIGGTVRTESGEPVQLVWVDAWSDSRQAGIGVFTGDDGTYEIRGLPSSADYRVSVRPDIFLQYEPAETFGVQSGRSDVDFSLNPLRGHEISGDVTDTLGNRVPNVEVEISSSETGFYGWDLNFGRYFIEGLPDADDYLLIARPEESYYAISRESDISVQSDTVRNIVLEPGYTLRGTVYQEDSGTRTPVSGVSVIAVSDEKNIREEAESGRNGAYMISNLPAGDYEVTAVSDCCLKSVKEVDVSGDIPFVVFADFVLETRGSIYGRVADTTGAPLTGVFVEAISESAGNIYGYGEFTETDENGNYVIPGLYLAFPNGGLANDYTVIAYPEDHFTQSAGGKSVGDEVDFTVAACGADTGISGVAKDSTGVPIADADVSVFDNAGVFVRAGTTGADGGFSVKCLTGSDYRLMFAINGSEQWADENGVGFADPDPESGGVPSGAGTFSPGDAVDFSFSPSVGPRVAKAKGKSVRNLKSLSAGDITNDPRIVVEWEPSGDEGDEETYYYKYNDDPAFRMTKRTAPRRRPQKTRRAASLDLKVAGEKVSHYFHVAPVDARGRIGETSSLGFLIDTVPPSNANVSEIVQLHRIMEGVFIDSPVQGLSYGTESLSGVTDSEGRFDYAEGETVRFAVGGLFVGEAPARDIMTPIDLVEEATDETHPTVTNICRLLQSLDEDGDLENGISIPDAVAEELVGRTINFAQSADDFGNDSAVAGLLEALNVAGVFANGPHSLATAEAARTHLRDALDSTARKKNRRDSSKTDYITLLLGVTGATEMYISHINYGEGGKWEKWTKIKNWKLPDGGAGKYIYIQFRDRAKNVTNFLFSRSLFRIRTEAGAGGTVSPSGTVTVDEGDDHVVTVEPAAGYEVDEVTVDGNFVQLTAEGSHTLIEIDRDHTIAVTFRESQEEDEADRSGGGGGCFINSAGHRHATD